MSAGADSHSAAKEDDLPISVWIGLLAMVVGHFMAILDVQIVASAIGSIQAGVSASSDEISWVQTAYLIAEVIGIPLSGFLARALGARQLFCLSCASFAFTSLLCAFAWDINSLMVFRALQGFCGAAMIPLTIATAMITVPPRQTILAMSLVSVITMFAPSIGPTLGGYIAEHLGWRALFWINLPPALLATFLVWRNMKGLAQGEFSLLKRVDLSGLIGLALFLGGAQYVLEEGPAKGWFESSELVLLTCVSACGAALFFYRAVKYDNPIVDLRPFKHFTFAVASALGFIIGVGMFAPIFLTPLFLSTVRGYNAFQIGETMFVQGVVMMCFSPCMGLILNRFPDVRPIGALGFLLMAASCWLQGGLTAQAGFADLVLPQILRGFGLAMAYVSVTQPALYCLPIELVHFGSGLFNTIRNIGGAFGIAFMTTLHNHAFALHRQELYSALDPQNPHVQQMLSGMQAYLEQTGARDPSRQALMNYAGVLDREALVMTFNDQFHLITIALIVSASAMLLLKPVPKKLGGQPKEEPANAAFEGEAEATT